VQKITPAVQQLVTAAVVSLVLLTAFRAAEPAGSQGDDEPLSAVTRMAFDPFANKVVPNEEVGRHVQTMDESAEHHFFEAERMMATATYINHEWVTTRSGYPSLYPAGLNTEEPRPLATTSPVLSGTGVAAVLPNTGSNAMRKRIDIERGGQYRLWVRYQSIPKLPAPFEVVIEQDGEELLRQRFNEEATTLCRLAARLLWESTESVDLKPGEATVRLIKVADEDPGPLRGPRYVDCFLLTNDLDYVAGGGELLPGVQEMQRRRAALSPAENRKLLLWEKGRYGGFFTTSWPEAAAQLDPEFNVQLPRNAHANRLLLVSSCVDEPLELTPRLTLNSANGEPFPGQAEVLVATHMISRYFGTVPHVLLHRNQMKVAPWHTAGLWLQIDTREAPAGQYDGTIELLVDGEVVGQVPVELRVFDRAVPSLRHLHVLLFGRVLPKGYEEDRIPEMREKYWANALEHGWNTFNRPPEMPWSADEARQKGVKAMIVRTASRKEPGTDAFREQVLQRLNRGLGALREMGWNDEDIWIEAFDEPSAGSSERWLAHARLVEQTVPKLKMWTNPGWQKYQDPAVFRTWAPHVDIWWPYAGNLSHPPLRRIMKGTEKPIGFYIERGWSGFNPAAAWSYFRRMPMLVAKYDLQGCGFWAPTAYYHDPWDDLNARTNYSKAAVLYPGYNGPINSINFAAWREGLDELLMLRELAQAGEVDPREWARRFLQCGSLEAQDDLRRELIAQFVQ
jgi:hypothetical protein